MPLNRCTLGFGYGNTVSGFSIGLFSWISCHLASMFFFQTAQTTERRICLSAEEKRLICMNALWRRMGSSVCVEKGNKLVSSNSLEW
ncbi:hypothetical protein RIR_jg14189.t1 [Rhizophagus irregularis DAOM 181602=DAOM 197198]|nr:hypothetical protein RIR_jg14189.t1 [Rhizophagus irregularis DAOM 181602=DAOM 197198]